jgi:hypothetical protein
MSLAHHKVKPLFFAIFKISILARYKWLMPIILATPQGEFRKDTF